MAADLKTDTVAAPRDLGALYPDRVTLVEIENAGHALSPEQPACVSRVVVEWLDAERLTGDN